MPKSSLENFTPRSLRAADDGSGVADEHAFGHLQGEPCRFQASVTQSPFHHCRHSRALELVGRDVDSHVLAGGQPRTQVKVLNNGNVAATQVTPIYAEMATYLPAGLREQLG